GGEVVRTPRRPPPDRRGDPGPRRLRLHEGVPGRALLPRREGHGDLRGHERDPAPRDRAGAARRRRTPGLIRRDRLGLPRGAGKGDSPAVDLAGGTRSTLSPISGRTST